MSLLQFTKKGIYCPRADFYIDATGKVEKNIVTHAHADHARPGHIAYLAHSGTAPLLRERLSKKIKIQSMPYNEPVVMNGVRVSLHPSGHIYGAGQVRVEYNGEVWVVSGDYKLEDDGVSTPFEPVKCHHFITECTFGLPVYHWPDQHEVYAQINEWWRQNKEAGVSSVLHGYSLGKSQRIIKNIDHSIGPVFVHRTVGAMNDVISCDGVPLPETITLGKDISTDLVQGNLLIAPPSFASGPVLQSLAPFSIAMASGWILTGKHMGGAKRGFVLSDHADWQGLLSTFRDTQAERIITMHGYTEEVTRYLNETGQSSVELTDLRHFPLRL
jgi:putative mRNA 3-end processing factor